jgi:hypothetical protein
MADSEGLKASAEKCGLDETASCTFTKGIASDWWLRLISIFECRTGSDFAKERTLGVLVREYAPVVVIALSRLGVFEWLAIRTRSGVVSSMGSSNAIRGTQLVVILANFCCLFERRARKLEVGDLTSCRQEDRICKEGMFRKRKSEVC